MIRDLRTVILTLLVAFPLWLAASNVGEINTFVNGTVADANEVNANFDDVRTAVDDNFSRINSLEVITVTLASNEGLQNKTTACSAGKTIAFAAMKQYRAPINESLFGTNHFYCECHVDGNGIRVHLQETANDPNFLCECMGACYQSP